MTDVERRLNDLFPDPEVTARRRRRRRARIGAAAVVALTAAGVTTVAVSASGSETLHVRTATVGLHDTDAVLTGVATVQAVTQASVSFAVAGTVDEVSVAVGDQVSVGQQLASLDTTALEQTLHERQATLAQAELTLADDLEASSSSSSSSSSASSSSATTTAAPATTTAPSASSSTSTTSTASDEQRTARQAVVDAQQAVDGALTAADAALASSTTVCDTTNGATSTGTSTTSTTTTTTIASGSDTTTACRTALDQVRQAQTAVATAQRTLATATDRLDQLVTASTASTGAAAATSPTTTAAASTTNRTTGTTTSNSAPSGGASASRTITSERLVADQKAVDAAGLDVIVATQAVQRADIVAPVAGTVVAVGVATGDTVTAASATQTITIVTDNGMEVTTTVDVARIAEVKVGQEAAVAVDGHDGTIDGEVVDIGAVPESSSDTSYRVTVALTGDTDSLPDGAGGTVAITTSAVTSRLAVPTSAVTATTDGHQVKVLRGTKVTTVDVTTGVIGDRWTEITDGLSAGDTVVLADLDEALPGSATATSSNSTGTTGRQGQFTPGAGGPPAGFGNGGPP